MKILIKLLLSSLSILVFFSDVSLATEQRCENKNNSFYVDEKSDIYKCVSYNVDIKIRIASDFYGKDYWALKAITDETDPFYESIKNLKKLMAISEAYSTKMSPKSLREFIDYISETEYTERYVFNIMDRLASDNHTDKSLNIHNLKEALAVVNFMTVLFSIHFNRAGNLFGDRLWGIVKRLVKKELSYIELQSGCTAFKVLVSKFGSEKAFWEYIRHDQECYLKQFRILAPGGSRLDMYSDSVFVKLDSLKSSNKTIFSGQSGNINLFNLKSNKGSTQSTIKIYETTETAMKFFCNLFNQALQHNGFCADIYKIDTCVYDELYIRMFKNMYDVARYGYFNESSRFDNSSFKRFATLAPNLSRKIINDCTRLNIDMAYCVNPRELLSILMHVLSNNFFLEEFTPKNIDQRINTLSQVLKMFEDLQLTDFDPKDLCDVTTLLLKNKSKSIGDLSEYITQLIEKFKTNKFRRLMFDVEKFLNKE